MNAVAKENVVRFVPAKVVGVEGVNEVAVFHDRLEIRVVEQWISFPFAEIARRQEGSFVSLIKRMLGTRRRKSVIGVREFCTERRYVGFFTQPELKIYTPVDSSNSYADTYLHRITAVLHCGGYTTDDLS